jgi:hypothetical protein
MGSFSKGGEVNHCKGFEVVEVLAQTKLTVTLTDIDAQLVRLRVG